MLSEKKASRSSSKIIRDRSVLWGTAAGSKDWNRNHSKWTSASPSFKDIRKVCILLCSL